MSYWIGQKVSFNKLRHLKLLRELLSRLLYNVTMAA